MNERKPNRMIPLIILIIILIISTFIVYGSMSEQRKKAFLKSFINPFGVNIENTNSNEEIEEIVVLSPSDALKKSNEYIENTKSIYVKTYKDKIHYRNLIKAWGYNEKENVYMEENNFYIDLNENIYYYIQDEKWHKKENEKEININMNNYLIPLNSEQSEDEYIDGALCYVFKYENKIFYIKQSTAQLAYIKEIIDEISYYNQINYKEISIREEIKEKAIN